jgi:hypothetical protein
MLWVLANYHYPAAAFDDLAFFTHGFYGRSDFHFAAPLLLLTAPCNPAARQVIRTHLHRDLIAREDADKIHAELSGDMREDRVSVADVNLKHRVGQRLDHFAF